MKYLRLTILSICLTIFVTSNAHAQQEESRYRIALQNIRSFGSNLTPQEKVGALLFAGGIASAGFHSYILGYDTTLKRYLVHLIYKDAAFPLALMVNLSSWITAGVGALVYVMAPTAAKAGTYTGFLMSADGFPTFMGMAEDEQLKYISWDPNLGKFVVELAQRLSSVEVLPNPGQNR